LLLRGGGQPPNKALELTGQPLGLPGFPAAGRRARAGWVTRDDSPAAGRWGVVHSRAGSSMPVR
jgi:hypothetical protein